MKKVQTLLIGLFVVSSLFAQDKMKYNPEYFASFPTYDQIMNQFCDNHQVRGSNYTTLSFAKKYNGWYVQEHDETIHDNIINEHIIWSAKDKKFYEIHDSDNIVFIQNSPDADYAKNYFVRVNGKQYYDIAPVYGYEGYELHIFELLENQKKLPAELMDILARSYSQYSTGLIRYGKEATKKYHQETLNPKDIDESVLAEYHKYAEKSLVHFKKLTEKYPDFRTIVGNIKLKYWNEHMNHYYNLMLLQQEKSAVKYLKDDLYNEFYIAMAKNYLKTCPRNAVLFTHGDTDTYALVYVQKKLGFRQDIVIINTSMSYLPAYIHYFKKLAPKDNIINTTLGTEDYLDESNGLFYITKEFAPLKPAELFELIRNGDYPYLMNENPMQRLLPSNSGEIVFDNAVANIKAQFGETATTNPTLKLSIEQGYFTRDMLFVLDIITTNNWKRPICFTMGTIKKDRLFLDKYIQTEGFVYRLTPEQSRELSVSTAILADNLLEKYEMPIPSRIETEPNHFSTFYSQALYLYSQLSDEMIKQNDTETLQKILTKVERLFPSDKVNYAHYAVYFSDYNYLVGNIERADRLLISGAKDIAKIIENNPDNRYYTKIALYMMEIAKRNDRSETEATLMAIFEKI